MGGPMEMPPPSSPRRRVRVLHHGVSSVQFMLSSASLAGGFFFQEVLKSISSTVRGHSCQ